METRNEIWKDIEGYEGYYQVSNFGRVRSLDRLVNCYHKDGTKSQITKYGRVLRIGMRSSIILCKDSSQCCLSIYTLVAKAFIPGYSECFDVKHKDGDVRNNDVNNLYFVKPLEIKNEVWKDIEGYEGYYQVSNFGRVKSLKRLIILHYKDGREPHQTIPEKMLTQRINRGGYYCVKMRKPPSKKLLTVHRLVAKAFVPGYQEGLQVNHKDENKQNNCAWNLEWVTSYENHVYGTARRRAKMNQKYRKPVIQMSMDGNVIKKWDSISEISKQTGICRGNIRAACNGKYKKTHGYRWRFAGD